MIREVRLLIYIPIASIVEVWIKTLLRREKKNEAHKQREGL